MYFPHVLGWFDEIGSNIAADFLERWPSLEQLQRARSATIERFLIDHNRRDRERIAQRLQEIRKAIPVTTDTAVPVSCSTAIVSWSALLKQVLATAEPQRSLPCSCGHQARYRELRARRIWTALGTVTITRPWYLYSHCHQGQFPADQQLDIENTEFSPDVRRVQALVGQHPPFDHGREEMASIRNAGWTKTKSPTWSPVSVPHKPPIPIWQEDPQRRRLLWHQRRSYELPQVLQRAPVRWLQCYRSRL
jgi:hypothetical protein